MTPSQTDILAALRSSGEAGDLLCLHAAAEIERLRLTDAEREAVDWAAYAAEQWYEHTAAATLRGLLERTAR